MAYEACENASLLLDHHIVLGCLHLKPRASGQCEGICIPSITYVYLTRLIMG